jgi:hypothetical protein
MRRQLLSGLSALALTLAPLAAGTATLTLAGTEAAFAGGGNGNGNGGGNGNGACVGNGGGNGGGNGNGAGNSNENSACNQQNNTPPAPPADDWQTFDTKPGSLIDIGVSLGRLPYATAAKSPIPFVEQGSFPGGTVVVCNSPGSKGGTWAPRNGYLGGCSTVIFNSAPHLSGNESVFSSNSLPL